MPIRGDYRRPQNWTLARIGTLRSIPQLEFPAAMGLALLVMALRKAHYAAFFSLRRVGLMIRRSFGPAVLLAFGNHHLPVGQYDL
jgi:hypothetical protein